MSISLEEPEESNMTSEPKALWYSSKHFEHYDRTKVGRLMNGQIVEYSFTFEDAGPNEPTNWPDMVLLGYGSTLDKKSF